MLFRHNECSLKILSMQTNKIYQGDALQLIKEVADDSVHLILSDIPYGIGFDEWDVLHNNTNSALLGASPAQKTCGSVFKKRGKPLNGWSAKDKQIGKEYYEWVSCWAYDALRVLKPGATAFVFAGRRLAPRCVCAFEDAGFTFKDMIAWNKGKAAHRAQHLSLVYEKRKDAEAANKWTGWKLGNLRPVFEPILWFQKPYKMGGTLADNMKEHEVGAYNETVLKNYGLTPDNIICMEAVASDVGLHPTQKPLSLMKLLIELVTAPHQVVLDPFCGSGTTLIAAAMLGRNYLGFEKDEEFYNVALKRIEEAEKNVRTRLFA